jgi:hypothetical protein
MGQRYSDELYVATLSGMVSAERKRAARAAHLVRKYQQTPPAGMRPLYERMAVLNQRLVVRHTATADLHERHIARIEQWLSAPETMIRPTLLGTVAATLSIPAAAVTLRGFERAFVVVAASNATAQAAQDLERVMDEGPATLVMAGGKAVRLAGTAMLDHWPRYGPAAAELGVHSVIAAPLKVSTACLGAICAYDNEPVIRPDVTSATETAADALTQAVLGGAASGDSADLFEDADFQPLVHQAVGMIAVHHNCDVNDAEALLRAHAFAENRPVAEIASAIVKRGMRLD